MAEIRSFIAIEIERTILERLTAVQQELRQSGADVSWTRPEGIHLTLKFLGNISQEQVPAIGDALNVIAGYYRSFPLYASGVGGFPHLRRPRVLWAGVAADDDVLQRLANDVDRAMAELGFPREDRPFRAHLTLGRVKSPANLETLVPMMEAHAHDEFGTMVVRDVFLMRSDLSPKGARYTELCRAPLLGDAE
ncbi:MAG TPA: RNA 2',3'-cyclic phosphodiesterase [Armatimonadota bacterium]|nr:RNA 2',3'-cyclic phosphodiesterase [Armatimonadota bacterium]